MYLHKIILMSLGIILFIGCTPKSFKTNEIMDFSKHKYLIEDFSNTYKSSFSLLKQDELNKKFYQQYFRPWKLKKLSYTKKDASWGIRAYGHSKSLYGENRRKLSKESLLQLIENANFSTYNSLRKKAITTTNTSLRVLPTSKPLFKAFSKAGEGYPFDNNQNSLLFMNHPLIISHYSKDKAWVFVESAFASGWVKSNDIAYVDETFIEKFKQEKYVTVVKDNQPIYNKFGHFLYYAKVGTSFPLVQELVDSYSVYVVKKDKFGHGLLENIEIDKKYSIKKPMKLNQENITKVANEFLDEKYGWGGSFLNRDCSAMTKDLFSTFGIWLPRNSYTQSHYSKYIDLSKMEAKDKEQYIIKHGKAFETIIYLKGHVMLYIGHKKDKVYVMHNIWGIRTKNKTGKNQGRKIIGKTIISTLYLGQGLENVYEEALLINKVKGISFVGYK